VRLRRRSDDDGVDRVVAPDIPRVSDAWDSRGYSSGELPPRGRGIADGPQAAQLRKVTDKIAAPVATTENRYARHSAMLQKAMRPEV
jgi:hypothetical protein